MPICEVTGARSTVGNNVPKSNKKTKKVIKTSIANRTFYSLILDQMVKIKCTKKGMDTIMKHGGIDSFAKYAKKLTPQIMKVKSVILTSEAKKLSH